MKCVNNWVFSIFWNIQNISSTRQNVTLTFYYIWIRFLWRDYNYIYSESSPKHIDANTSWTKTIKFSIKFLSKMMLIGNDITPVLEPLMKNDTCVWPNVYNTATSVYALAELLTSRQTRVQFLIFTFLKVQY